MAAKRTKRKGRLHSPSEPVRDLAESIGSVVCGAVRSKVAPVLQTTESAA